MNNTMLEKDEDDDEDEHQRRLIYLVKHNPKKCSFVQVTRNIERHGGSMAIIIDEKENDDISKVTMSDDGTGAGIRIPAVLISKSDGQKIVDWIVHASPEGQKQASIKASFLTEFFDDGKVMVEYWYTSGDDRSLDFVRDISKYVEKLSDVIIWTPRMVTWACPHCEDSFKSKNCVSDGKYCAMKHSKKMKLEGVELLQEDLR